MTQRDVRIEKLKAEIIPVFEWQVERMNEELRQTELHAQRMRQAIDDKLKRIKELNHHLDRANETDLDGIHYLFFGVSGKG